MIKYFFRLRFFLRRRFNFWIREKEIVRIMITLLKVKLQVTAIQLVSLLKRKFCYVHVYRKFWSNCFSELLLEAGSERLDIKYSLSLARKASKDLKKLFAWGLQNGSSEKVQNVQEKYRNPASVTLTCDFIVRGLHL